MCCQSCSRTVENCQFVFACTTVTNALEVCATVTLALDSKLGSSPFGFCVDIWSSGSIVHLHTSSLSLKFPFTAKMPSPVLPNILLGFLGGQLFTRSLYDYVWYAHLGVDPSTLKAKVTALQRQEAVVCAFDGLRRKAT